MTIQIDDVVRVVANMKLDTVHDVVNTYHFRQQGAAITEAAFMVDIANVLDLAYGQIDNHISDRITFVDVTGQNLTQDVLLPDQPWPIITTGLAVDDMLPEMNCPYVFWRTLRPKTRKSVYLPPFTEGGWSGLVIPAAAMTSLNNFADEFEGLISMSAGNTTLGAFNPGVLRFEPVTTGIPANTFRTQRRRRIGVGS